MSWSGSGRGSFPLLRQRQPRNAALRLRAVAVRDVRDRLRRLHDEAQEEKIAALGDRRGAANIALERLCREARWRRIEVMLPGADRMIAGRIAPR